MKKKFLATLLVSTLASGLIIPVLAENSNVVETQEEIINENNHEEGNSVHENIIEEKLLDLEEEILAEIIDEEIIEDEYSKTNEKHDSVSRDVTHTFDPTQWTIDFSKPNYAILKSFNSSRVDVLYVPGEFDFGAQGVRQLALEDREVLTKKSKILIVEEVNGKKVKVLTPNMYGFFYSDNYTEKMDLRGLDTSEATIMEAIFQNSTGLKELNVTGWDTSSVINMKSMFDGANSITEIDLESWDVSKVKDISWAFRQAYKLETVHFSTWNFTQLEKMNHLFIYDKNLKNIDMSNWNTSTVKNMYGVFWGTEKLTELDVKNWDVSNVETMDLMFYMTSIKELDLGGWNVENVKSMGSTFASSKFETLLLTDWNLKKIENLDSTFAYLANLKELDSSVSNWDVSNVTNMYNTFGRVLNLESLDLSSWDVSKVEDMSFMFNDIPNLKVLNLENWETKAGVNLEKFLESRDSWPGPVRDVNRVVITSDPQITSLDLNDIGLSPLSLTTFNANTLNDNGVFYGEFPDGDLSKNYTLNEVFYDTTDDVDTEILNYLESNKPVDTRHDNKSTFTEFRNDNGKAENFIDRYIEYGEETFDARWTNATLTYNANTTDSTLIGSVPNNVDFLKGTAVTVSGNTGDLERLGYKFAGWSTKANPSSTDVIYGPETGQTAQINLNESATLYAVWKSHEQTINWHLNNGEASISTTQKTGETIVLPTTPIKKGYVFEGWYSDSSLTVKIPETLPALNEGEQINYYAKYDQVIDPEPEKPEEEKPGEEIPDKEKPTDKKSEDKTPKTGIQNNQSIFIGIIAGAIVIAAILLFSKRLKKDK